jgi:hypothetical protein
VHSLMRPSEGGYPMRSCEEGQRVTASLYCCFSRFSVWHLDLDSQRLSSEEEMKMNPEVKARWVAALRSGAYQQTHNRLTDHRGGFCCLGVLCDLYAEEFRVWATSMTCRASKKSCQGMLVCAWAGLNLSNTKVVIEGKRRELFWHNDGVSYDPPRTFAQIADAIEEQL